MEPRQRPAVEPPGHERHQDAAELLALNDGGPPAGPRLELERMLADEHRWANNQVRYMRGLLAELRLLAEMALDDTERI